LPPSFGSDNNGLPSLDEKLNAPVARSMVTVTAAVESFISFFPTLT
jgi:hypothetical protein